MLPIREQIMQALAQRTGAERFNDGQAISEMELPATVLLASADQGGDANYDLTQMVMPVTIARAIGKSGLAGDQWHEDAQTALADLVAEVYTPDASINGLVRRIVLASQDYDVQPDGAQGYVVQIELEINYEFANGNPYTTEVI